MAEENYYTSLRFFQGCEAYTHVVELLLSV
jgi:hypothetical protein